MVKATMALLLVVMSGYALASQDNTADGLSVVKVESEITKDNISQVQLGTKLKVLEHALSVAEEKANAAKVEYDKDERAYKATTGSGALGFLGISDSWGAGSGDQALKQKYLTAKAALNSAQEDVRSARTSVGQLNGEQTRLATDLTKANSDLTVTKKALTTLLKGNILTMSFSDLNQKVGDVNTTLNILDNQLDKAAIGAYLKDKIGLLINSDLFCSAMKRCHTKAPNPIPNKAIESLFESNSNSNTTRTGEHTYYDQMHPQTSK